MIDVTNLNVIFPPEGLFIGIEIVEAENQPYVRYWGAQKNIKRIHYGPSIGTITPKHLNNGIVYYYNPKVKVWVREMRFIPLISAEVTYFKKNDFDSIKPFGLVNSKRLQMVKV
ncbi:MAG: hypothetical protein WHS63_01250 [Tenuifilum sp.]|uniref:hypothetical protein n=1 Tax=Tenuifilum sp. TaxID=2760880 RepID=UPI0030B1A544